VSNWTFGGKSIRLVAGAYLATTLLLATSTEKSFAGADHSRGGGDSASQISPQGTRNSNGPNSLDRDAGLDRARDRMSNKGLAHSDAGDNAQGKKHSKTDKR
jgi:hypothetical protein